MMKAVLVFCEGNHDIVFVTRSLGAIAGATWIGDPISKLPSPFGPRSDPRNPASPIVRSFIAERYGGRVLDDLKLMDAAHPSPPSFQALVNLPSDDTVYVILKCGGDDAEETNTKLLSDLSTQLTLGVDVTEMAAAFLFDADDIGVSDRETAFEKDYGPALGALVSPKHASWTAGQIVSTPCPVGLYIFHDSTTKTGTLEGILGPLVEAEWSTRWHEAGNYLTRHANAQDPVGLKRSEQLKAQICVTGQFRFPGDSMTQVISRDGLPGHHFQGTESRALVDFLRKVPW